MTTIRTKLLAAVAALGLIGTGAALKSGTTVAHATPNIPTDNSSADVAESVVDSVDNIAVTGDAPDQGGWRWMGRGARGKQSAKGSGVIISTDGRILTNS